MNEHTYDLVLVGGHIVDPAQALNKKMDLAIKDGKIAKIAEKIDVKEAKEYFSAAGLYISPGFIDIHTHVYRAGTALSVDANKIYENCGVMTFIDAGSAGAGNFLGFKELVIDSAKPKILAYLNISFAGIFGFSKDLMVGEAGCLRLLDIRAAVAACQAYPELIVGLKVRVGQHAGDQMGLVPLDMAIEAATEVDLPIMSHIDFPPPRYVDVIERLRPGDVLTHAFRPYPNAPVVHGKLREEVIAARERGVYLDVGHGMGGFSFKVADVLREVDFWPDTLSSDVHILCVNGPAFDLTNVMSKFLCLGMPFEKIIASVTKTPAQAIRRPELGSLAVGNSADITLYDLEDGKFIFEDAQHIKIEGNKFFRVRHLVRAGKLKEMKLG